MKRFLQTAALCFAIVLALAFAAPAFAAEANGAESYTAAQVLAASTVQATTNVNVRSGPGTGYTKLGVLAKGDTVEKTGVSGSWTQVVYNGRTAYVSSQYLKDAGTGTVSAAGTVQATANVNVRSGPGTGYSILGVLAKGGTVQKTGVSGSWTQVVYNGKTAYVSSQYLKDASSSSGTVSATGTVQATANVNVRSGPGTGYSILGVLAKGSTVQKTGVSGSWTQVVYNGATAYVSSQYLTAVTSSGGTGSSGSGVTVTSGFDDAAAADLVSVINGYRAQQGIAKLVTTDALNKDAKIRAQEIVQQFSHTRPDGTLVFTVDPANINGENIAKGTSLRTGQSAADAFMGSEGHRENAMRTTFTKTGSACLRVDGVTYWVHLFGY